MFQDILIFSEKTVDPLAGADVKLQGSGFFISLVQDTLNTGSALDHIVINGSRAHVMERRTHQKTDDRKHFVRVVLKQEAGKYLASTTGAQGSGILRSMSKANGLAVIDEDRLVVRAGEDVPVMVLDQSFGMSEERLF